MFIIILNIACVCMHAHARTHTHTHTQSGKNVIVKKISYFTFAHITRCCGWECLLQGRMFECLFTSWWCCLGRLGRCGLAGETVTGSGYDFRDIGHSLFIVSASCLQFQLTFQLFLTPCLQPASMILSNDGLLSPNNLFIL